MSAAYFRHMLILSSLFLSLLALLLAPVLMPDSYDWIAHTTSESGAQGIEGAWLARTGFVLYAVAVMALSLTRPGWALPQRMIHAIFALGMLGNALFSSRPWTEQLPYDALEDTLHSLMSGVVGTAFTVGVLLSLIRRHATARGSRILDLIAIISSVAVTFAMFTIGGAEYAGLLQRIMFAVSYLWYANESVQSMHKPQTM